MRIAIKVIFKFLLPILIVIIALTRSVPVGLLLFLAYLGFLFYTGRAGIYIWKGGMEYSKGNMDGALAWYKKAWGTGKAKPRSIISYGYLLLKCGIPDESEKILRNLILDGNLGENDKMLAKSNYALVLWKSGKLDEAVEMLEKVHASFKTTNIYGSLGYMLILKGDLDRALEYNLEAYEYNNGNGVILDNLGQTYYMRGELDKAEEIYTKLIETNPAFPEAYYNYGLVLLGRNEAQKALEQMNKALNCRFTFLSALSREEIEEKISEIERIFLSNSIDT